MNFIVHAFTTPQKDMTAIDTLIVSAVIVGVAMLIIFVFEKLYK
jgi:hypothetical protein